MDHAQPPCYVRATSHGLRGPEMKVPHEPGRRPASRSRLACLSAALAAVCVLAAGPAAGTASASSIQSLSAVSLSTTASGVQHVRYTLSFNASSTGALASGGTIKIAGPAGTVMP